MNGFLSVWATIQRWFVIHHPQALQNLRGPADSAAMAALEAGLPFTLPAGFKSLYRQHDGAVDAAEPSVLPDGFWFLPIEQVQATWALLTDLAADLQAHQSWLEWRSQVESGVIFIQGAVKPLIGSPYWLPFAEQPEGAIWFLDFDPPVGGVSGQVIEVDPDACTHRVLAPSLFALLEIYAQQLESGVYAIDLVDQQLRTAVAPDAPESWGLPDYLQDLGALN